MKKILLIALVALCIFMPSTYKVEAANDELKTSDSSFEEIVDELLKNIDTESFEKLYQKYLKGITTGKSFTEYLNGFLNGENSVDYGNFFEYFFKLFFKDIYGFLGVFACVTAAMALNGLLSGISVNKNRTTDVAFIACYLSIALLVFGETATLASEVFDFLKEMTGFIETIYPVLITLVAASGGKAKANALKPASLFVSQGISSALVNLLIPLISIICVLGVISSLSEKFSLKKTKEFFQSAFKWVSGICVTVFSAFTVISGLGAASYDGVSLRALKYTVGNAVPAVGSFAKEGIDVALAASYVIKNSLGGLFSVALIFAFLLPLIKILALSLVFKLLAAVGEPLADKRITDMISSFSETLNLIAISLILIFVVFFFTVYILVFAGGNLF